MKRALRSRHRWMIVLLALIVPTLVIVALSLRRPLPRPAGESTASPVSDQVAPVVEE